MSDGSRYMSIITNFGCHYECPYCIVKENNLHIPETTLAGLDNLVESFKENDCNIISISGGGDPLYEYEKHIDWYRKLFGIAYTCPVYFNSNKRSIPIEMHTSYMTDETSFPFYDCYRVVYHANNLEQLTHIHKIGNEITRVVFVVTEAYSLADIMNIALYVENNSKIDELSFRQLVDGEYKEQHYLEDYLRMGHKKLWWYIEQNDYNLYYAENRVSTCYRDFENTHMYVTRSERA